MARPSVRTERRAQIVQAFEEVLARHGIGGATIAAIAQHAGVAPGLLHHHFRDRDDLVEELVRHLARAFRGRIPERRDDPTGWLLAYTDAVLSRGGDARPTEAMAWVGIFAESIRLPTVATLVRRALSAEVDRLGAGFEGAGLGRAEAEAAAASVMALIAGALVFGALVPDRASGFAAPAARRLIRAWIGEVDRV